MPFPLDIGGKNNIPFFKFSDPALRENLATRRLEMKSGVWRRGRGGGRCIMLYVSEENLSKLIQAVYHKLDIVACL